MKGCCLQVKIPASPSPPAPPTSPDAACVRCVQLLAGFLDARRQRHVRSLGGIGRGGRAAGRGAEQDEGTVDVGACLPAHLPAGRRLAALSCHPLPPPPPLQIDIVESINGMTGATQCLHYGGTAPDNLKNVSRTGIGGGATYADAFHTFAVDWSTSRWVKGRCVAWVPLGAGGTRHLMLFQTQLLPRDGSGFLTEAPPWGAPPLLPHCPHASCLPSLSPLPHPHPSLPLMQHRGVDRRQADPHLLPAHPQHALGMVDL